MTNSPSIPGYKRKRKLGGGSYGTVYVYETSKGEIAGKTSCQRTSIGYPKDLLIEVDALTKLSSNPNVIHMRGLVLEKADKVGHVFIDLATYDLVHWLKTTPFAERCQYLTKMLKQIGSVVYSLHYNGFIHGDLKTNNILVKKDKETNFFLADFGRVSKITPDNLHTYRGVARFLHPYSKASVYLQEYWALMVVSLDVLLGRIQAFSYIYSIDHVRHILRDTQVPAVFWTFFGPLFDCDADGLLVSLRRIGAEPKLKIRSVYKIGIPGVSDSDVIFQLFRSKNPTMPKQDLELYHEVLQTMLWNANPKSESLKNMQTYLEMQRRLLKDINYEILVPGIPGQFYKKKQSDSMKEIVHRVYNTPRSYSKSLQLDSEDTTTTKGDSTLDYIKDLMIETSGDLSLD